MKVFVTGATGYIGCEVAKTLARNGHDVFGLIRKKEDAKFLQQQEITPVIGSLDTILEIAKGFDAIIHCAFESPEKDQKAVEKILTINLKKFIYTSGVWVYGNRTEKIDETSPLCPLENVKWRPLVENLVLDYKNSVVLRPGCVYGYGKGLFSMLFQDLIFVGNGTNHWPLIHVNDLARVYLLAIENDLSQTILNVTETPSVKMGDVAEKIGTLSNKKPLFLSLEKGMEKFGPYARGLEINLVNVSSEKAQKLFNWKPLYSNFLSNIKKYWETWNSC